MNGQRSTCTTGIPLASRAVTPPHLAYIVSRFPATSETFWLRELDDVAAGMNAPVDLISLFPAHEEILHPRAQRWQERHWRPTPGAGVRAWTRWMLRSPRRSARVWQTVIAAHAQRPRMLLKATVSTLLAGAVARRMERSGVTHIHAHFITWPALAAWVTHQLTGIRYSVMAHGSDLFAEPPLLGRIVTDAAFAATVSEYNARVMAAQATTAPAPLIIPCGPDTATWQPVEAPAIPSAGPLRVVSVGRLSAEKGHRYLLAALAHPECPPVSVRLIGEGPERAALMADIDRLGLADRVELMGRMNEDDVRAAVAAADIFVLPSSPAGSRREGVPVSLMEAMALARPVIATRLTGIPELVRDDETGLLVPPADPAALARALARYAHDPLSRERMAQAGRAEVERAWSAGVAQQRLQRALRACIPTPVPVTGEIPPGAPRVSVVVPMRNEADHVERLVRDLRQQDMADDAEFILVDGMSEDATRERLTACIGSDTRFRILDNPHRVTPYALNIGLAAARAPIVVRMDAHTRYPRHYVRGCVERLEEGDVAWVSGPQLAADREVGDVSRRVALALQGPLGVGGASFRTTAAEEFEADTGFCGGIRTSTLRALGGWDEDWTINQDAELAARVRAAGGRIIVRSDLAAYCVARNSYRALGRQYRRYGYYRAKTAARHPRSLRRSHLLAPGVVVTALVALSPLPRPLRRIARLGIALWGVALLSAVRRARRAGAPWADACAQPAVLATMHASWGSGFLLGLLRFRPLAALMRLGRRS